MALATRSPSWYKESMTIPLDIIRTSGRAPSVITAEVLRPLEPGDIAILNEDRAVKAPPLARLRERHHALARNIASGMKHGEAAAICGYDISRVSILMGDPTFRNLVEFYREDVNRSYAQLHETLSGLAVDAAVELRERIEDNPESLSSGMLNEIVKMAADRTGFGPSSKQEVSVNVNIASRLEEARKRVALRTLELERVKDEQG